MIVTYNTVFRHRIADTDSVVEIESDEMLTGALSDLEDGFRLTVWAYDKAVSDISLNDKY